MLAKVAVSPDGCWNWTGATRKASRRDPREGGQVLPHGRVKWQGKAHGAHRVSLALALGVPVESLGLVAHECDNCLCINPAHLRESTPSENLRDAYERGRRSTRDDYDRAAELGQWFEAQAAE
jgi:hypothetical protein